MALADRIAVLIGGRFRAGGAARRDLSPAGDRRRWRACSAIPTINLIDVTPQTSERGVSATIGDTASSAQGAFRAAVGRASLLGVRPEAIGIGPAAAGASPPTSWR